MMIILKKQTSSKVIRLFVIVLDAPEACYILFNFSSEERSSTGSSHAVEDIVSGGTREDSYLVIYCEWVGVLQSEFTEFDHHFTRLLRIWYIGGLFEC